MRLQEWQDYSVLQIALDISHSLTENLLCVAAVNT